MKNDRLIWKLIQSGELTADMETGEVFYRGKPKGYTKAGDKSSGKAGYLRFSVHVNGKRRLLMCHRVVWMIGTDKLPGYGLEVNHISGEKTNNAFSNLELVTGAVNVRHAHKEGLCSYPTGMSRDPATGQFISELPAAPF